MGGRSEGRPVTNSRLPTGATKKMPRPVASCQPVPCSNPSAEKRLVSRSNSAPCATALINVIPLIIVRLYRLGVQNEVAVVACWTALPRERPVSYETLLCQVKDQAGPVTLNRPAVLNALDAKVYIVREPVFMGLSDELLERMIVLTGEGE